MFAPAKPAALLLLTLTLGGSTLRAEPTILWTEDAYVRVRHLVEDGQVTESQTFEKEAPGIQAFHQAVERADLDAVRQLLESGVVSDRGDDEGRTPLHLAAMRGQLELVELLLAHGAPVNLTDGFYITPLDAAVFAGHEGVARALRAAGGTRQAEEDPRQEPEDGYREGWGC